KYFYQEPIEKGKYQLDIRVKANGYSEDFNMAFNIKELKTAKHFAINKDVTIQGQKISFVNAEIYPLRVGIHIKMDPNNTKKLVNFDDLHLVDEIGETWSMITNGVTGTRISDDEAVVYLQSNSFKEPKELYIALNKIQAVDKDESNIV